MKILAIRGENLASLHGPFAIELQTEPLASAGLFTITGPTGSGKSTLLDALCLALFDRTPRTAAASSRLRPGRAEDDDKARISAQDPRSLLRRGAVSGFAEVEFIGRDRGRYRARWSVRRARDKADGALQFQELTLHDARSGLLLCGGKKGEVLAAIQQKLGLDFDQLRRSALLAQGDFAAFLRADENERGALLQAMTGTAIYEALSIAAFQRAKAGAAALDALVQRRDAHPRLPEAERADLEASLAAAGGQIEAAEAALRQSRADLAWLREQSTLRAQAATAQQARAAAAEALALAAPRREALRAVEAAQPLRAPVAEADRAQAQAARALEQQQSRAQSEAQAQAAALESHHQLQARTLARDAAREAAEAARPALQAAAALDSALTIAEDEARKAAALATQAADQHKAAEATAAASRLALTRHEARITALQERLTAASEAAALAPGWSHTATALDQLHRQSARLQAMSAQRTAAQQAQEQADAAARSAEAAVAQARAAEDTARAAAADAEARYEDPLPRQEAQAAQAATLTLARELLRLCAEQAADAAEAAALAALIDEAAARLRSEEAALIEVEAQGKAHKERLEEAERARDAARSAFDLRDHRALLREGEACPLCGATEHPFAGPGGPGATLIEGLEARCRELTRHREQLRAQYATLKERIHQARERAPREAAQAANLRRRLEERAARLAAQRPRLGALDPVGIDESALEAALQAALPGAEEALRAAEAALTAARASALRREQTNAQAEAQRRAREATEQRRDAARDGLRAAETRLAAVDQELRHTGEDRLARIEALAAQVGEGHRPALFADPAALGQRLGAAVAAWLADQRDLTELTEGRARLVETLTQAEAQRVAQARQADEAAAAAQVRKAEAGALRLQRQGCLGGATVEAVQRQLGAAIEAAEAALLPAQAAADRAQAARAQAEALFTEAVRQREEADAACALALAQRDAVLKGADVELDEARARLSRGEAWRTAEATALRTLEDQHTAALAAEKALGQRLADHEAAAAPPGSLADAEAGLARAEAEAAALRERRATQRAQWEADQAQVQSWEALEAERCARAAEQARWADLNALIGSADGKAFRKFAQSLSLEALLGAANRHLDELAPRYQLVRVPGTDLELQVLDRHMGDELRSTASLSGGEAFLASLALALGLSSLSARDISVETLFIDEGFGTLDPATLETALSVLDQLQAQGRQVGLISHVPGLSERVGAAVRVEPRGNGRSVVRVVGR